ncbi:MAG TPA: hypothetical protein VNW68_01195, partial [Candidatus Limnocylindria bacterium]|nr:hypothetical protein [Candidatus Limnocylindria bacterium]
MGVLTAPTRRSGLAAVMLGLLIGTAAPGAPAASAAPNSLGLRASYDVQAKLDYGRGRLSVTSTATVANPTDASVGRLLFNLLPARIGRMSLGAVSVAGEPAATRLSGQSIVVILPTPLAAGARTTVTIAYSARFATDAKDKNWLFAKINGIVTAYRWIPWLSRATAFARPNFGEPFVTGTSRRVKVSIRSDRKLTFATTGRRAAVNGLSQR